jgi:uncharacterized protein YbjQ (UPF0145 family)
MWKERVIMSVEKRPVGKIVVRTFEAVLAALFIKADLGLFYAGKHDAAVRNVILTVSVVVIIEALMWLAATRAEKKWQISSDEVFFRGIQVIIIAAMVADATSWLITGEGFGVHQPGCLLSVVILEGIIRRFIRPDPRPPMMAQALKGVQANVKVFTHLPPEKVRDTLGLVRGISDIEASSRLDFELAEQEALYLMLKQARELGANAVVDARLTTGTYETNGSQWQVSRPVYTGTAVRI